MLAVVIDGVDGRFRAAVVAERLARVGVRRSGEVAAGDVGGCGGPFAKTLEVG